jgi:hypothetical protein
MSPFIHSILQRSLVCPCNMNACWRLGWIAQTVAALQAAGVKGANVTVPFKLDAFALASASPNSLTPAAEFAQAANTLKFNANGTVLRITPMRRLVPRFEPAVKYPGFAPGAMPGIDDWCWWRCQWLRCGFSASGCSAPYGT